MNVCAVQYVSFRSRVRHLIFGLIAMCSVVLFILSSRLLEYSAGSRVNKVQVVLSGFSVRLLCFDNNRRFCSSFLISVCRLIVSKTWHVVEPFCYGVI